MGKAKVKLTVKPGKKGSSGILLARVPVTVVKNDKPSGKPIYQTQAQITAHISRGQRPEKSRLKWSR